MPTIVFVSPKGGAGKTTAALLLATQIARGAGVTVIDADPNHPIKNWAAGAPAQPRLQVVSDVDENNIIEAIEAAAARTPFVVVDLEGTAAKIVILAVSQADLVIVPTQGSQLDAEQAGRALKVIRDQEKMSRRPMPFSVLLTRTNVAVKTRSTSHIHKTLLDAGLPVFATQLHEREAFRAVFSFRQTLEGLDPAEVSNLDKAIANAEAFATEVVAKIRAGQGADDSSAATRQEATA
jgi:chromosome partitioning protein